jgi:hypothetical protein
MKVYCNSILGFDHVDGKLVPNTKEMEIISFIKSSGLGPDSIASKLNSMGYHAKKGGKFYPSTIRTILNNEIYN